MDAAVAAVLHRHPRMQMRIYCLLDRSDLTEDSEGEPGRFLLLPWPEVELTTYLYCTSYRCRDERIRWHVMSLQSSSGTHLSSILPEARRIK